MRFLKVSADRELSLTKDLQKPPGPYTILSHTWGEDDDEVTYDDIKKKKGQDKPGCAKLWFCINQALVDRLEYCWVDTCCINKANHVELSEAITSMFRWYQEAAKCYVYMSDVSVSNTQQSVMFEAWETGFRGSRWFTRGWTLQELLAPKSVEFFSKERAQLGSKQGLEKLIQEITSIPVTALQGKALSTFTVDERLRWATGRHTKKIEDQAYSLLGIFGVFMPLIYGEGENAMARLKKEINNYTASGTAKPTAVIPFGRDADFVERGTVLDEIFERCTKPGSRTALVGLGGVGKSQLAIEHAYRTQERSPSTWIFWLYASNITRFEQSYRNIASCAKIPGRDNQKANIFQLVHDWLKDETTGRWLLILDNIDDASFLFETHSQAPLRETDCNTDTLPLASYLPQCPNGSILITTRSQDTALRLVEACDTLAVHPMSQADALTLLHKKLGKSSDRDHIDELATALDFMPLALVQAAAYIVQRAPRCSVQRYLEEFRKSDHRIASLLNFEGGSLRRDPEAKNSIITTWQISFEHIRQARPSAAGLLSLMSFFDRQGIPEELLHQRQTAAAHLHHEGQRTLTADQDQADYEESSPDDGESASSDDRLEDDIATLRSYSFIAITVAGAQLTMHRLVQLATQRWLKASGQHEQWQSQSIANLDEMFPSGEYEYWKVCQQLFPHVKSAVIQKPKKLDSMRQWASLLYRAAWYALDTGNWRDAEKMSLQSMETREQVFGEEHPDTLASMTNLALTYQNQGRWKEAEDLEVQVLEISSRVLGEEHPSTLASMANLALTYSNQGRWKEAEDLQVQDLEISSRVLGEEHPSTLASMANLALTYSNQGRWKEAEDLQVQDLEIRTRVLGEEHPDTLTGMANLASTYWNQGRWNEAEDLEVQVLEIRTRVLGEEHPSTLTSMANLAHTLRLQGQLGKALSLMSGCLERRLKILGPAHQDSHTVISTLRDWSTIENVGSQQEQLIMGSIPGAWVD